MLSYCIKNKTDDNRKVKKGPEQEVHYYDALSLYKRMILSF